MANLEPPNVFEKAFGAAVSMADLPEPEPAATPKPKRSPKPPVFREPYNLRKRVTVVEQVVESESDNAEDEDDEGSEFEEGVQQPRKRVTIIVHEDERKDDEEAIRDEDGDIHMDAVTTGLDSNGMQDNDVMNMDGMDIDSDNDSFKTVEEEPILLDDLDDQIRPPTRPPRRKNDQVSSSLFSISRTLSYCPTACSGSRILQSASASLSVLGKPPRRETRASCFLSASHMCTLF